MEKVNRSPDCGPSECKAKEVVNQKKRAQYSTPAVAIAIGISESSDEYAGQLAMPKKNLLRAVSKTKSDISSNTCPNWSTI